MLAYAIVHRQAPQPRRRIAGQFWPETSDSQARTNLRKELHHLRRVFPEVDRCLVIDKHTLLWQPHISCEIDLDTFTTSLDRANTLEGKPASDCLDIAALSH